MSTRLRAIARENQRIVEDGHYLAPDGRRVTLAAALEAALHGTRLYGPEPLPVTPDTDRTTRIRVTAASSTAAALHLAGTGPGPLAVLSFASARNPGGGYINGAQAQEEALCRASALYHTLLRTPGYYTYHRENRDPLYSDRVIHSPAVPVFRDHRDRLLDTPRTVGFLTSPAPNAGAISRREPERLALLPAVLARRAERVLEVAADRGYRRLVLGAWGCGVFRNDPATVAAAFRAPLTDGGRFARHFDEVEFAVLDRTRDRAVLGAFRAAFEAPVNSG
ncbi:TIGR02452 family protein [Streptomyces qinzhouensis]|uniref:TIGR02452 family protein n=1 Tax=Streptomyces qinzhouensis TaxID=2599401 RepID=A0A5B8JQS4_9ACTN|nr:TIGR02452 family protein [Streptomyces qinzhouensis]QDY80270.1 TIGR02452 family protein [Streptomyces qinzhouensis]